MPLASFMILYLFSFVASYPNTVVPLIVTLTLSPIFVEGRGGKMSKLLKEILEDRKKKAFEDFYATPIENLQDLSFKLGEITGINSCLVCISTLQAIETEEEKE